MIKVGHYIKADLNFKPGHIGQQKFAIEGEIVSIINGEAMLHNGKRVNLESPLTTLTVYTNVAALKL